MDGPFWFFCHRCDRPLRASTVEVDEEQVSRYELCEDCWTELRGWF